MPLPLPLPPASGCSPPTQLDSEFVHTAKQRRGIQSETLHQYRCDGVSRG